MIKQPSKVSAARTLYTISILIWFAAWSFLGDATSWLTLLNRFVLFLFVPIPVFLVWGLYARRYKGTILLLAPTLIFAWLYHPYVFPRVAPPVDDSAEFRAMMYNVLYSNSEYEAVANVIKTHHPDVVALQEVQPAMMNELKERLTSDYPYAVMGTEDDYGTTAVFSRHPIVVSEIVDLQAGRPAVAIKVRFDDRDITFVSLHMLAYNLWRTKWMALPSDIEQRTIARDLQVNLLLEQLDSEKGTIIVGCDCNSYETSGSYRSLDRSMNSAARQVGWVVGSRNPPGTKQDTDLMHIDHVWYRGSVQPIAVYKIEEAGGSDHLPVLAIFNLR